LDVLAAVASRAEVDTGADQAILVGLYLVGAPGGAHDLQHPLKGLLHTVLAGNQTAGVVLELLRVGERFFEVLEG